ncbi:hypothetical protein [Actinoplanes sp. NPDC051851]|uniref:hypothetical protein n=1 Tax=Actinoplanes sp. NPDC051851 TaxID=3154753 RepID=UPI00341D3E22
MAWDDGGIFDLSAESDARDTWVWRSVVIGTGALLIVALEPSGAGMAAAAIGTAVVVPNVVDPEVWTSASGEWSELFNVFDAAVADLTEADAAMFAQWKDSAAESFHGFVNGTLLQVLARLREACNLMDDACTQMAIVVISTLVAYFSATVGAIVAALASNAGGPFSPAAKWAVFGVWAPVILAVIAAMVAAVATLWTTNKTLGDAFDALKNKIGEKDGRIDAASVRLPEPVKAVISRYDEWEKKS